MKKVKCAICGIVTDQFIRYELIPYCIECFFTRFNYCSKCGGVFSYENLKTIFTKECKEFFCEDCYEELFECRYCKRKIGLSEIMYVDNLGSIVCENCKLSEDELKGE